MMGEKRGKHGRLFYHRYVPFDGARALQLRLSNAARPPIASWPRSATKADMHQS